MIATMVSYIFREPRRNLRAWLGLFGGALILLLSSPYLGLQWSTGPPTVLLGLGCLTLGAAELTPRNDAGRVLSGCLRIAGYLFLSLMVVYIVVAVLP